MLDNKLFRCEVGGATYWVSALHGEHAREVLLALSEHEGSDPEDVEEAKIAELSETDAAGLTFYDDGDGAERPMWDEHTSDLQTPRVVACSEWV